MDVEVVIARRVKRMGTVTADVVVGILDNIFEAARIELVATMPMLSDSFEIERRHNF